MRVLFLDFDGVLNSERWLHERDADDDWGRAGRENPRRWFDPKAIARLNRVVLEADAKVVVSSSWRILRTTRDLEDLLHAVGFKGEVVGKTRVFNRGDRGEEILEWITWQEATALALGCESDIESFAAVDDGSDLTQLGWRFVKTSWAEGLLDHHVDELIAVLHTPIGVGE